MDRTAPDRPSLLIVIPCLNEEDHIADVVRFAAAEADGFDATIVVADGMSADRSPAIVRDLAGEIDGLCLLPNPGRFQSAGVNLAVEQFGGDRDLLVRLDAHSGYPAGFVRQLVACAARVASASVVVPMQTVGSGCFQRAAATAQNSILGNGGSRHRAGGRSSFVDHGHHALIRLDWFRRLGGYDPTFSHNEDAEFDQRLRNVGGAIWMSGETPILYYPRKTPQALFSQYFRYGRGRCRTILKHRLVPKLRQALPMLVVPALAAACLWPPALLMLLLCMAAGSVLAGIAFALKSRQRCDLMAGFAATIMHVAWSAGFWREILARACRPRRPDKSLGPERDAAAGGSISVS